MLKKYGLYDRFLKHRVTAVKDWYNSRFTWYCCYCDKRHRLTIVAHQLFIKMDGTAGYWRCDPHFLKSDVTNCVCSRGAQFVDDHNPKYYGGWRQ